MRNDLARLSDQITDAIQEFSGSARKEADRGYQRARSYADDALSDFSERGQAWAGQARDAAYSLEESLEDAIHERPLATVGLAIGIGFLLGFTMRK